MNFGIPFNRLCSLALAVFLVSGIFASNAYASTTALNTGTGSFDNFQLTDGQYFAFATDVDAPFTVESVGFLIGTGKTAADLSGSTVSFYKDHPSSPTNAGDLIGTLNYSSIASEASLLRVTFTGTVSINSAGRYWWKISNLPTGRNIWVRMGNYTGITGTWTAWNGTANWDLNGSISNSVGEYPKVLITGTPGASGGGGGSSSSNDDEAKRKEAERIHQEKVQKAKDSIVTTLKSGGKIAPNDITDSDLPYISVPSLAKVNAELALMPIDERSNLATVANKIKKYSIIENIQSENIVNVTSREMKEFQVIPVNTPQASNILWNLKQIGTENRNTQEKIDAYVVAKVAEYQARMAKLEAVKARIAARNR